MTIELIVSNSASTISSVRFYYALKQILKGEVYGYD